MDSLGGYRIVRKLGEGPRAEVLLAHPIGDGAPAVIKVFRPGIADASILAEIEALARAAGEHAVQLLDVTTAPDGAQALILGRLPGASLGRLLRDRAELHLGEAITLLAPLALAVRRLHLAGVVHGGIRQDAVLFDAAGAPVLACFGHAFPITPGQPPALLDAVPGVGLDIRALATLAGTVLGAVDDAAARALADWVASTPELEHDTWLEQLADRLFDLGLPEPIDFTPAAVAAAESRASGRGASGSTVPGRLASGAPVPAENPPLPTLPAFVARLLPDDAVELVGRARVALRVVRPRVWVVAASVGLALVAALVLVPQGEPGAAQGQSAAPNASATPTLDDGPDAGPVGGDDPVAALVALLKTRDRCIRDLSVLCLDAVGQAGSAALAADQQLVRSVQGGAESPVPFSVQAAQVTVDERLGDSVILGLGDVADSEPASILLMKGEAGWRIRDYVQ